MCYYTGRAKKVAYNNWRPTSLTSDLGKVAGKISKELRPEIQRAILHGLHFEHRACKWPRDRGKPSKTPVRNSDQALAKSLGVTLNHTTFL